MKLKLFAVLSLVLLGSLVALAAPNINIDGNVRWMRAGFWVLPQTIGGQTVAANKVTRMLGASLVIDFAAQTATCVDSASITVTGALANDPCMVGAPVAAQVANASFTCIVTAADTVKVRFCPTSAGAIDPLSGTFLVRTVSSQ